MTRNVDDHEGRHSKTKEEPDNALEKLEELWDRQIMRGDDDSFEDRDLSKSDRNTKVSANNNRNDGKPLNKRRGRRK